LKDPSALSAYKELLTKVSGKKLKRIKMGRGEGGKGGKGGPFWTLTDIKDR
jgi:hypothetical protein